jgi:hypothetical protein
MPDKIDPQQLSPLFRWQRPWPWPEPGDPGPPWELIISRLDKAALVNVVGLQLNLAQSALEAQKTMLDAQMKAVNEMRGIIKGMK